MKKLFTAICLLLLVFCSLPLFAGEGMKKLCAGDQLCVSIPEKAPEFATFKNVQVLEQNRLENGNVTIVGEFLNADLTVDVIVLIVGIGDKINIVGMIVNYAPESFPRFNESKKHVTDVYEDVGFMKTGKISGVMIKVPKPTEYKDFEKFLIDKSI